MARFFLAFLLMLLPGIVPAAGFDNCTQFFFEKTPPRLISQQPGQQRALCFDNMAILHSGETKTPLFVAEKLNRAKLKDALDESRTNQFYEEARLPKVERATLADYKGSGYDRGHMAPAADQPTPEAMAQSFSLANMVPQSPKNNRGIWAKAVEKPTRQYAMRAKGDIYVITGPVFEKNGPRTGQVSVPKYLFKLVYDPSTSKAWAYWVENSDDAKMQRPIEYADLVKRTGLEFIPAIKK